MDTSFHYGLCRNYHSPIYQEVAQIGIIRILIHLFKFLHDADKITVSNFKTKHYTYMYKAIYIHYLKTTLNIYPHPIFYFH